MAVPEWRRAIFRVAASKAKQSADAEPKDSWSSERFVGTAFVCARNGNTSYLLTCGHVVGVRGSRDRKIAGRTAEVVLRHEPPVDIAVLKVEGLSADTPVLPLPEEASHACSESLDAITYGWTQYDGATTFKGAARRIAVDGSIDLSSDYSDKLGIAVKAWDLKVIQKKASDLLHGGYSGAPLVDVATGRVMALVSHQIAGDSKYGHALDLALLDDLPDNELPEIRRFSATAPALDDYGNHGDATVSNGLAYMLDHDKQLPVLKATGDGGQGDDSGRHYFLLPACRSDRPSLLAYHLMFDSDHSLLRIDGEVADCIKGLQRGVGHASDAFWSALVPQLLPRHQSVDSADIANKIWQVLNRRSLTVVYTPIALPAARADINRFIAGAMQSLEALPALDSGRRLVVLFGYLRPEWRWLPRALRDRLFRPPQLTGCAVLKPLHRLSLLDVDDWINGLPPTLAAGIDQQRLKSEMESLFSRKCATRSYASLVRHLIIDEGLAKAARHPSGASPDA